MTPSHLVELENVEQVEELAVLLTVLQFAVVLLQAVQRQLRLIIHKHLHRLIIKKFLKKREKDRVEEDDG